MNNVEARWANRLYLFAPAYGWVYCGGATIICAETLDDAVSLGNALKDEKSPDTGKDLHLIPETTSAGEFIKEGEGKTGSWIFVEEFELAAPRRVGLVFAIANYA